MRHQTRRYAAFLFVLALTYGCAKDNDNANDQSGVDTTAAMAPPAAAPAAPAPPTDAQIAHIAVTANQIDIDNGKVAETKAQNAEVKAFAKQMIADHGMANKQAGDVASKNSLTPEDNPTSQGLNTNAATVTSDLSTKTGADFDKAYIDSEVNFHQTVLNALDQTLIPNAQNADLKALLTNIRPVVNQHLEHAQRMQKTLSGTK